METTSEGEVDPQYEFLKVTWDRLGVGQDGLLSLEELSKVCSDIGLDNEAIQEVKRLFGRLDIDQDGMITFQEFLHIFQSTSSANQSQVFDDSMSQETSSLANTSNTSVTAGACGTLIDLGTLSTLDPGNTGWVSVRTLLNVWQCNGLSNGSRVLRELCLPHRQGEKIQLNNLVASLDEECRSTSKDDSPTALSKQATLLLVLNEVKDMRLTLEKTRQERDQYRWSLKEENHKVLLMAQELDEHNSQMDSSAKQKNSLEKQVRELQDILKRHREQARDDERTDQIRIRLENSRLKEEESKLKNALTLKDDKIRTLENDGMDLSDKLRESEFQLQLMEKELSELRVLEDKFAELQCTSPRENEFKDLLQKVDVLSTQNNYLKDNNDELLAQIDSLSSRASVKHEDRSLDGSVIGDYVDPSSGSLVGSLKRRGEPASSDLEDGHRGFKSMRKSSDFNDKHLNIHYFDLTGCEESFDASLPLTGPEKSSKKNEFSLEELALSPRPFKPPTFSIQPKSLPITQFNFSPANSTQGDGPHQQTPGSSPRDLVFDPSLGSSTPVKLSTNHQCQWCTKFWVAVKNLEKLLTQGSPHDSAPLERTVKPMDGRTIVAQTDIEISVNKLKEISQQISNLLNQRNDITKSTPDVSELIGSLHDQIAKMIANVQRKRGDLTPLTIFATDPRGITTIHEEDESGDSPGDVRTLLAQLDREFHRYAADLVKDRDLQEKHKAITTERCAILEKDLQILKADYSSSEDYWSMKMKEEQEYYEEERNLCDEKFAELVNKINEYEMLTKGAAPSEIIMAPNSIDSDRLTPIDESVQWEKQMTELEAEMQTLQKLNENLSEENEAMELIYQKKYQDEQTKNAQEISDLLQTNELLRDTITVTQTQHDTVRAELQKYQQNKITSSANYVQSVVSGFEKGKSQTSENNLAPRPTRRPEERKPNDENSGSLYTQLSQAKDRIQRLENALKTHQKMSCEILTMTNERHSGELQTHQTMNSTTQQALTTSLAKCKDLSKRAYRTDFLVSDLYLENANLMKALLVTEQRQKQAEKSLRQQEMQKILS